jgi:hypothetical protein
VFSVLSVVNPPFAGREGEYRPAKSAKTGVWGFSVFSVLSVVNSLSPFSVPSVLSAVNPPWSIFRGKNKAAKRLAARNELRGAAGCVKKMFA